MAIKSGYSLSLTTVVGKGPLRVPRQRGWGIIIVGLRETGSYRGWFNEGHLGSW
jgi:hypothetical protein